MKGVAQERLREVKVCPCVCPPGVVCAAGVPGPDAGEGTFPEGYGSGTSPASLPEALRPPLLHHAPDETLPASLTSPQQGGDTLTQPNTQ